MRNINSKALLILFVSLVCGVGVWAVGANYPDCTVALGSVTDTTTCKMQSTKITTKIYKIGICTSLPGAPTTTAVPDFSSCSTIFENSSGGVATVNGNVGEPLSGTMTRPSNGSYAYAYIILSTDQSLQQSVQFNSSRTVFGGVSSGSTCWSKSGTLYNLEGYNPAFLECDSSLGASLGLLKKELNSFDTGAYTNTNSGNIGGTAFNSYLLGSDLLLKSAPPSNTSMGDISRFLIAVGPFTPLVIDDTTTGIDLGFSTSRAAKVKFDPGTGQLQNILSGELLYSLTVK
jgi:hypothetical protein